MEKRIILKGLRVEEFIHPREVQLQDSVINSPTVRKLIESVGDVNLRINKTRIQGTYIQLYPHTAPRVFAILKDVCRILDHSDIPELYVWKSMNNSIMPCTAEKDYLILSDYVLEQYDDGMLYYGFGNAIAMIRAGHVKLTTAAAYMGCNIWTVLPQMKFKEYLHAADATSDRGGLLACQSLAAAARCHFLELGMPPAVSRTMFATDEEAADYIERYLFSVAEENDRQRLTTRLGEMWQSAVYFEAAANLMLADMYVWYRKEYKPLLEKYRREGGYL
ncbi:MAG: hypothetical protein Q4C58_07220 [Eubacteriales bacterium]|nr:hypothetical protein [Eubacteriales bacterium]